ncbi:MAG: hypothetical protein K2H82_00415 [Oscillospiraceae bacterium]|nr:hypothetical protein [Oscillospiraceae bacterium]
MLKAFKNEVKNFPLVGKNASTLEQTLTNPDFLIQKEEYYVNQVKFVKYYTTEFNTPMQQSLIGYTTEFT